MNRTINQVRSADAERFAGIVFDAAATLKGYRDFAHAHPEAQTDIVRMCDHFGRRYSQAFGNAESPTELAAELLRAWWDLNADDR